MIHKWVSNKRNKSLTEQGKKRRTKKKFGDFEQLEDKRCLAFLGFFDGVTLEIEQTVDDGDILVENINDVWRATDNAGTFTFVDAQNVTVELLSNTVNQLDVQIETEHPGNLVLNLGDGAREVFFTGALNEIGGNLEVNSDKDTQEVSLGSLTSAPLIVHGTGDIHLGEDFDFVFNENQLMTFDGDLRVSGVNEFNYSLFVGVPGPPVVRSDVFIDTTVEDVEFFMIPNGGSTILGDFNFTGGVNIDHVDLGATVIEENVTIDLGIGEPFFGDPQNVLIAGTVLGDVNIVAGDSNLGNLIELTGAFAGNIVSYTGGNLVDTVIYSFAGDQADVFINLGGGDDTFELNTIVNQLEVDFGNDLGDVFTNNLATIDFEVDLLNLHFFNHIYTAVNDRLVSSQIADTGDVVFDNDGGLSGFDWQVKTGLVGAHSTLGAENLVVNLLSNTGNNLEMDLINPVIASIELNIGDGNRSVLFTGISNNPLRDITINGGTGDQFVDLAVNHPLGVATLNVSLGTGFDTVVDTSNLLQVDEDLIFSGVNQFEHTGIVTVFRDATVDTSVETEDSLFAVNDTFVVGDDFFYIGGDGADEVRLNGPGGARINDDTMINLGDSVTGGGQTLRVDSANSEFNGILSVISTNANTIDTFGADAGTEYFGTIDINLGGGTNNAGIVGIFNGTSVAYNGGSGVDTVTYGLTGTPADLTLNLGAGDDHVDLLAGSSIGGPLVIDFGPGNDSFNNQFGTFTFDAMLLGLQGFNHNFVLATGTLTATQVEDLGDVGIDDSGPAGSISFKAGLTTADLTPVNNLTVNMLDGSSSDLDIGIDNSLSGNLQANLGDGARLLTLTGVDNSYGGQVTITGGTGDQTVDLAVNNDLSVGGNLTINLDGGNDVADENGNNINVTGDASLIGVNTFVNNNVMMFGGNLLFDVSGDSNNSIFSDNSPITIAGNFTYVGNSGDDTIIFDTTSEVGGNMLINAGGGNNTAVLVNVLGGNSVIYNGGSGVDMVTYGTSGASATLDISLGAGDDNFTLNAGTGINSPLTVNFGTGADTFTNNYGLFDFNANLNGLNGFNHAFNFAGSSLMSTQVESLGPAVVDNNGVGNSFQFTAGGGTSSIAPADHLTINMLDGSGSNLDLNLDNALAGDLTVDLGDGTRTFNLGGTDGTVGGQLDIDGGSDGQTVDVDANVTGDIHVDLGNGDNQISLAGTSFGAFDYTGGSGTDLVDYDLGGSAADITADTGGGDDTFHLMPGAAVNSLNIDFGSGTNVFTNDLGALTVPTTLMGVDGFNHVFDPVTQTLTSIQTVANGGPVTFDNNGPDNAIQIIAGSTTILGDVDNLDLELLNNSLDTLNIDLDNRLDLAPIALAGDLDITLGDGLRTVNFIGDNNSIGGDLNLTGGSDAQDVNLGIGNGITIAGTTTIDSGSGADILLTGTGGDFGGDVTLSHVNTIQFTGNDTINGNLNVDNAGEVENSVLDLIMTTLTGELNYLGGAGNDAINLPATTSVGGDIDLVVGSGTNSAVINSVFGGASIRYTGTSGTDMVTLGSTGNDAVVNTRLGTGDDAFVLEANADIATNSLRVDFGGGDDSFVSNFGQFDFNAQLLDLDGFNTIFDLVSGNIDITQVSDTGDVTIDNNGPLAGIRFGNGGTMNSITPANDVRLILQDNTSTNVTADFDNVRNGITTIQLRSGDRDVTLTGNSNTYNGLLRFEASDGVQNVNLAANADLNVTGTLVVNTRDGNDTVSADNAINVSNAMLLRSVNNFVNNNGLDVGGDFNMITLLENQDTRLINNDSFMVGGNLTFLGGGGVDTINFKSNGATIDGFIYVDLSTAADAFAKQRVSLTGGFSASNVVVDGGSSIAGTFFSTDAATTVTNDVIVNLAPSTTINTAVFMGNYGGTYGTYRGGLSSDFIVVGANAPNMLFAVLANGGNDVLTVEDTTNVDFLYGDMGGGNDTLDNQFPGDFPFDNNIFNL